MSEIRSNILSHKKRVFLDIDSLTQWDLDIHQRFPKAEKVPIHGLEPGPVGSWDAVDTTLFGTVLQENGLFRMWYYSMREAENTNEAPDRPLICYAESENGIHWRKPDLKITGQRRYPGNNLLALPGALMGVVRALPGSGAKYLAATIMYAVPLEPDITDLPGNPNPTKDGSGTHIWASDDGLRWRHVTKVLTHGDFACLYADEATNRYLLYNKCGIVHGLTMRRIGIGLESRDGKHWEGYHGIRQWRETLVADDYDDLIAQQRGFLHAETYAVGAYRAGEILVSIETIFNVGPPLRQMFAQNPNGLCHLRLGFSHDGFNWRYPKGRPSFLELGAPGEMDAGFFVSASTFTEHGDDLLLYYGGSKHGHGWCINPDFSIRSDVSLADHLNSGRVMMARIKRDRFASLAATYRGCFDVDAGHRMDSELFINLLAREGQVRVALAEKTNHNHASLRKHDHLEDFSFDDCLPIAGDHVCAPVKFRHAKISDIPADKPLTLRFELTRAEIFAYEWGI